MVSDNILSNNHFVIPCPINIVDYSVFFLGSVYVDNFVFLGNYGVDIISVLMGILSYAHPYYQYSIRRK